MPLSDPSRPPTFSQVYRLLDVTPKGGRLQHAQALSELRTCERDLRYAVTNAHLDRERVIKAGRDLDAAKHRETETKLVLVLLEDMTFRRELANLDSLWRRFRMTHTGATNDRFADVVMGVPEEQTVELRASWQRICDIIAVKATATPVSALTL